MKTSSITLPARRNSVFHGCFNGVIVAPVADVVAVQGVGMASELGFSKSSADEACLEVCLATGCQPR